MAGTLYLVGTPIGNLGDLTERARQTLAAVDLVAAEDTRRTGRLLSGLGLEARMVSFFEGNEQERIPDLLSALAGGEDVAVVSDAGMPGLSDPGYRLVAACVAAGIAVDVIPGPSAVVSALVVSGLPTNRFAFEGFIPRSGKARSERLEALAGEPRTIVLFESPHRVASTLRDLLVACGDRSVAVVRELTKLHQEVVRGRLSEVLKLVGSRELKGEIVLVVEGGGPRPSGDEGEAVRLAASLVQGGARKREAARRVSELTGVPSGRIYDGLVRQGMAGSTRASFGRRAESSE
jgi:16S rRNA (cytidine1402-2'-O)-methyltransferase